MAVSICMSMSSLVFQTPQTVTFGYLELYDNDPNISLGTTQPSTPTLSITVNQLPAINGSVAQSRYLAIIIINTYNGSGATNTINCRLVIGSRDLGTASSSVSNAYYTTFRTITFVNLNDTINIYAWGSASGFTLRRTYILIIPAPKLTTKFSGKAILVSTKLYKTGYHVGSGTFTLNNLLLASDDVQEASLSDAGIVSATNLLRPTIYIAEEPFRSVGNASTLYTVYIIIPQKAVYLT
jgi:hypothetical protein